MKLKETLCLPRTDFPMKGALPQREPERLARWREMGLDRLWAESQAGRPLYVLHDGPPYANGHVHLGTALNKLLKDFVLKARSQAGFRTPYVPGWDCHGMPIEHQVLKAARARGEAPGVLEIRKRCRAFAEEFLEVQRREFRRLGILGEWDRPYLTMDPAYEATIVEAFGRLHAAGHVYKGLRSIHWCPTCRTALANAEVEHDPAHRSLSIHVRFPIADGESASSRGIPAGAFALAWTTTPWTIPANVALAVHADAEYVLLGGDAGGAIVARERVSALSEELGWAHAPVERAWVGRELAGLVARHPLVGRDSPVVVADHVTLDSGTGIVHTAPGHGEDDFETGVRHGLPILVPVDKGGVFTAEAGVYAGRHVFEANEQVVKDLEAAGKLARSSTVVHSYPTCWRCHQPLIFLATEQWFLRVEHEDLRARCLEEVDRTEWIPAWGRERMRDSVASRPDWCLSRQRAWGVPIPAFSCTACHSPVLGPDVVEAVRKLVAERGTDAWFEMSAREIVPPGTTCGSCGSSDLEKDPNILDVWFDASCSHLAVLEGSKWPELAWPADLYLEAVDQHRGWFQVSLLNSVALRGRAPYRAVFTHGLILDERGRKMSKSLGNVVSPDEILESHGTDVLRLFFASVDATSDVRFSRGQLDPVSESYRKIRNTLRFLLGNLAGFDPEAHAVPERELLELDAHALDELRLVSQQCREAYAELSFVKVHRLLLQYLTTDVSAFYAHVLKDRLYCDEAASTRRRSAQTVLFEIARECCQLLAPVTCFTADEVWVALPAWPGKEASVHLATWRQLGAPDAARLERWEAVHRVREDVLKALELARAAGLIGDPLEAAVTIGLPDDGAQDVAWMPAGLLAETCVVSELELAPPGSPAPAGAHVVERERGPWILVKRSAGVKCPRCWMRRHDSGRLPALPETCARCAAVLAEMGPVEA